MNVPLKKTLAALSLTVAALTAGCRSAPSPPDLGALYNRSAQHHGPERNPVIIIPGILGSKLVDPDSGRVVWGAFGGGGANPQDPDGARLVALPMRPGATLDELTDTVVADGVLEKIRVKLIGLPIQLQAYFEILRTLGAGGYRDESFAVEDIDYGEGHITCFQFAYDFRRDNVENARRLHEFIVEKRAYLMAESRRRYGTADPDLKFDVIAHSMGGLLLRYYLRFGDADLPADGSLPPVTWAGARHVARAVLIGTPNAGAVGPLLNLVEGRKFGPIGPRYDAAILGTHPAMYQLLARVRHGSLASHDEPTGGLDFMDPALWEEHGWGLVDPGEDLVLEILLPEQNAAERRAIARDHLRKSLERARQLHAALDQPASPPAATELYLMAGDAVPTPRTLEIDRNGKLRVSAEAPGDGRVLRSSALMDERLGQTWTPSLRSPIDWTHVTFLFANHLGLTRDPVFTDNLLYLLLEAPRD